MNEPFDWSSDCPDLVGPDWWTLLIGAIVAVTAAIVVSLVAWLTGAVLL